ncbi:MAG: T9SS type A sorting domain-containing protein [Flavobacteriales bacterium]|nr:T9SS type A sorting domain-containing protein [Flavobacteriales bacterium]
MRNLSLLLAGLPLLGAGQVTIQYSDVSPFGLSSDMYVLNDPSVLAGLSNGPDQAWDLSAATFSGVGTMDFRSATGTPYADDYPQANWAWIQNTLLGTDHVYLEITSAQVDIWALRVPSSPSIYTNPSKIMAFPLSYGETFDDSYVSSNGASDILWTYAGYGTLSTSIGVFDNVVKMTSDEGDLILWNTSPLYPVLYYEGSGYALAFVRNDVGIAETAIRSLNTAPNPCHDMLVVRDAMPGTHWSILDAQGRTMTSGRWTDASGRVAVGSLAAGTYVLVVNDGGARAYGAFVKE